jgi:hypothetical protein
MKSDERFLNQTGKTTEEGIDAARIEIIQTGTRREVQTRTAPERGVRRGPESRTKTKFFRGNIRNIRDDTTETKTWKCKNICMT